MANAHDVEEVEAIPAATLIVFRQGQDETSPEILMVTRSRSMAFAGGAAVFPGGRVDPSDFELARTTDSPLPNDEIAHRIAAIRETLEETGLVTGIRGNMDAALAANARELLLATGTLASVLERFDWRLDLQTLLPFARWYPKNERLSRVFDTRFYLADLGTGNVEVAVDETENTRLFWTSARDALASADRGDLQIIFPTRRNLERLAQFADFSDAARDCTQNPVRIITPFLSVENGEQWLRIPDNCGYPITGEPLDAALRG